MSASTTIVPFQPVAMIRATFTNTGEMTVERRLIADPAQSPQPVTGRLTDEHPEAIFSARVTRGLGFAALLYTVECWMEVYPLQTLEAIGGDDPFPLDPVTISHPTAGNRQIAGSAEVFFHAQKNRGSHVVTIKASRPGSLTILTIDRPRPATSIALFARPDQHCELRFTKWPEASAERSFQYPW